jgi:hypothetical protein
MTTLFGVFTLAILRLLVPLAVVLFVGEMLQRNTRAKKVR